MRTKSRLFLYSSIVLVSGSLFFANSLSNSEQIEEIKKPNGELIFVDRVIDGDTIKITFEGKSESVRIIGINTPETKHPQKPIECFGPEASKYAEDLLGNKKVILEFDESQGKYDKYDRLLAYVWTEDGQLYSELAIKNGFAFEDTYDGTYKYQKIHKKAQETAESNKLGLWMNCPNWPEYSDLNSNGQNICDPNYSGACIPVTKEDLDCSDIGVPVNVIGVDIHRLDKDGDKKACLSS